MRKEAKKGTCDKCGRYFYIHEHHVLPQARFGKEGETVKLCPSCHTHFHEYQNLHQENLDDAQETQLFFYDWLKKVALIVSCIVIAWGIYFFIK